MKTSNTTQFFDQTSGQPIMYQYEDARKNGIGIAGFVMSITGLILCWVPIIKWLLLVPAFLLSFLGMFKKPKTLAIIGVLISALTILIIITIKASFYSALMSLHTF